jgi:hypothetical protein
MKKFWLILLFVTLACTPLQSASLFTGMISASSGGGAAIPPACNNSLDFSQTCNSVYLNVVVF